MNKKLISLILIFIMAFVLPIQALAAPDVEPELKYLNIGDSIAYGLSAAPGYSYYSLYSEYLENGKFGFTGSENLGLPGLDSMELRKALYGEFDMTDPIHYALQMQLLAKIPEADVISISIGGNNLLTPVIASTFALYPDYASFPGSSVEEQLMHAIAYYGETVWNAKLAAFTASAMSSEPPSLGWALETRTAQFREDWPAILDRIEYLNPHAKIIAMTLYNPIDESDNKVLYDRYEELVKPMNKVMMKTQNRVMLANVAKAFSKEPDAVAFKLTWGGMIPVLVDPHPTTFGHSITFNELLKTRNPMSFR